MKRFYMIFIGLFFSIHSMSQQKTITLPQPQKTGGMPLMEALDKRHSTREFASTEIPEQSLSNLLWAAWGINREGEGKHTAPSSNNKQEIDIYVATSRGLYKYIPAGHQLEIVSEDDIRQFCGNQDFVATAPVNLVFVADLARTDQKDYTLEPIASYSNAGFISQNVYLFCASEGLGTVVRGWVDKEKLRNKLHLTSSQRIILAQTIGYPAN